MFTATIACSRTCGWRPIADAKQDAAVARWKRRASPSCASPCRRYYDLGQEFFRWEIATAVAGSVIGINAFNQPDVEASKIETRKLTDAVRKDRLASAGISVF